MMDPKFGIDPDLNVHEQVAIARHAVRAQIINPDQLLQLARLVVALDDWITHGGELPTRWSHRLRDSAAQSSRRRKSAR